MFGDFGIIKIKMGPGQATEHLVPKYFRYRVLIHQLIARGRALNR